MLTFFSCRKISRLISESQDRDLAWNERMVMKLHLCICVFCNRFFRQARILHEALQETSIEHLHTHQALSNEARQRIQQAIAEKITPP